MDRYEVAVSFGRLGVALTTISRALALNVGKVETACRTALERGDIERMPPLSSDNPRESIYTELVNLRADLADARYKLRMMTATADSAAWSLQVSFGLTKNEAEIFAAFVKHGRRNKPQLYHVCYGQKLDDDMPEPKIIDVFVCKLRKKLDKHGIEIKTMWSAGYELTPDMQQKTKVLAGLTEHTESPSIVPAAGVLM